MPRFRGERNAFGSPGVPAVWTSANKQAVGTAYSFGSRVWFTVANGILTEAFYPRIDTPQLRDLQFLFVDGGNRFLEEKHDFNHKVAVIPKTRGCRITSSERSQRFSVAKELITDTSRPCILLRAELQGKDEILAGLKSYLLCAPHLKNGGTGNNAYVIEAAGCNLLAAEKNGTWLVLGASCRFAKSSCGYVGASDGYSDLTAHRGMAYEYDRALEGNVALTAELDLSQSQEFTVGLAFGETLEHAVSNVMQSLAADYYDLRKTFVTGWTEALSARKPLGKASCDSGQLYEASCTLLAALEDKTYQGTFVASPAVPWGEFRNDLQGKAGYHVVWTRDMVEIAMALLAAGDTHTPLRALINLCARQEDDGSFAQNSWVDGKVHWKHLQLDEVALPVILASRLSRDRLLGSFDPSAMVRRAGKFLLLSGPVTGEERWEELSGYSPSTLATVIAAMVCAGRVLRDESEPASAAFVEAYADWLVAHLEEWTVTTQGSLIPNVKRHFVRINPAMPSEVAAPGAVDRAQLHLPDQPPGEPSSYPAREIIDAGFLQLVRYGIIAAKDPLVVDSVKVVDSVLMRQTPDGRCWRRYNHDGYGQHPDGAPFDRWGQGGGWPLLTGERAHYEIAAGGNYSELVRAMENFAKPYDLLPEQVWDEADRPQAGLFCGKPTGSAMPLLWAHAEYVRLLRSLTDGQVYDLIPDVASRYLKNKPKSQIEYWMPLHPVSSVRRDCTLRICAPEPFRIRWSPDQWKTYKDADSSSTAIGVEYYDLVWSSIKAGVQFTLFWKRRNQWEGRNYGVEPE